MATESDDGGHGHGGHLPAVEDWPRGFGEASWWPFVTALGAGGFYVGAALYVLGNPVSGEPTVSPILGPAAVVASTVVFLAGLYGWLYHGFVVSFWSGDAGGAAKLRLGMVAFLGSEVATFGAGFVYYFFIRAGTWPPTGAELPHLVSSLVLVNTLILVISSVTLHYAHVALLSGDRTRFVRLLGLTLALGAVFIGGQVYEYYQFVVGEGFGPTEGVFNSAFFGLTGLHGLHVSLGAVLIGIVFVRALYGQYSADRHVSVSTVSMYWHFVDAVWLFLVVVLYVGAVVDL